ncbi:CsgG/HfaB family protein [Mesoterricola sediminis]|uniref:SHOCT domain-containing protein n=1 Tax=Mesoterricola sediminis TaxID=2927980 RepID=A0AA48GU95_9BACT|nr:CsgG/HfaB family protein [Mesoterricola sediminis]BDU75760.1 hypothetical protein METESE_07180 [Mesoterricola sediminis]
MRMPAVLLAAAVSTGAQAQLFQRLFNPEVEVTLTHPPGLGLQVRRVAFAPVTDRASAELADALAVDLAAQGTLEVMDRANLDKVLAEQKLGASGLADEATAVALGRLIGAPVLLIVKTHAFRTREVPLTAQHTVRDLQGAERQVTTYISRTEAELSATLQVVDCATGRLYRGLRLSASPYLASESMTGRPPYPSSVEAKDRAVQEVLRDLRRLLLPWTERRRLVFYDDRDFGMKAAYGRVRAGDAAGALRLSLEARDLAQADPAAKPRQRARAQYNAGICHFIQGDYAAALPLLEAAQGLEPGNGIFLEALAECRKAQGLLEACRRVEARSGAPSEKAGRSPSLEERLRILEDLRAKGLLSEEEAARRKAELLQEI